MTKLPKSLTDAAEAGTLLPIVGAGVSMSIKNTDGDFVFPSWKVLLKRAAAELDEQNEEDQATMVRIHLKRGHYQKAATDSYNGLKGTPWTQFFKKQFDPKLADLDITTADLPKAIWQLGGQIITLNYDRILTWAAEESADISVITNSNKAELADFQKGSNTKPTVWHLHGHVDDCAKIVLTAQGYEKLYAPEEHLNTEYEAALQTLKSLSAQRHLLFIGCGMDDADLLAEIKYQQTLFGDNTGPHFALVRQAQLANIQSKIDGDALKLIAYEDFGDPLVKLVKEIASYVKSDKPANPSTTAVKLEDAKPAKIKMAVLTANPINNEQDYSHWLSHFDKIDADIDHFSLTVDHLNNLDEYQYIFILSRVVKDRLLIEDDYLSSQKLPIGELEEAIYAEAPDGIFYLLDKLPEVEFTLEHPSLLLTTQDSDLCRKALFELFKKNKFAKIEGAVAYNPDQLKLTKCYDIKNGKGIRDNTSPLPLAVDPNNLKGLVGRRNDLENICRKLIDLIRDVGVLTVKGSGGIGKTTLVKKVAFELAQRGYFNKGIDFVDCEPIENIDTFSHQIASAFGCQYDDEFSASSVQDCDKPERLIILDNLETLLYIDDKDACLALIQNMSNYATVVITTRELSKTEGEELYELRPFTPDEAFGYFVQQAKRGDLSNAESKLLREEIIENRLDNNPLAIKLVTANMPQGKSLASLKADLEDDIFEKTSEDDLRAFDAKSDINIDRKRSIYGSIAYSYKNLSEAEQTALLLLSTFPSGLSIDNLTQVQNWAAKEKMEVETAVTDRTIRALQNKSMVENHGEVVTLQSIVGKFAEGKLASHPAKDTLLQDAFRFQERLVLFISIIFEVDRKVALYMADNMLATLVKSIELCGLVKRSSSIDLSHIARVFTLLSAIGELQVLKNQLQKCSKLFDGEYRQLLQIWIESIVLCTNKLKDFDAIRNNAKRQISHFEKVQLTTIAATAMMNSIANISSPLLFNLSEHLKSFEQDRIRFTAISLFFFYGAIRTQTITHFTGYSVYELEIRRTFNLEQAKDLDKNIQQLHDKDYRKIIEFSYIRAKIKPLSKSQINALNTNTCYSIGLKALISAFSEFNNDKKERLFKEAIGNLLISPYHYAEAHYYYAEFLQQQSREEFDAVIETGMATVEKYYFRYLQYLFEKLRGLTDKPEYDPKDYPMPDGIDFEPYVQEHIDKFSIQDKKTAPKKLNKQGKKKGKKR